MFVLSEVQPVREFCTIYNNHLFKCFESEGVNVYGRRRDDSRDIVDFCIRDLVGLVVDLQLYPRLSTHYDTSTGDFVSIPNNKHKFKFSKHSSMFIMTDNVDTRNLITIDQLISDMN